MFKRKISYKHLSCLFGIAFALSVSGCSDSNGSSNSADNTVETDNTLDTGGDRSGIDLSMFDASALASSNIVDCELSDGTATQCYELVTLGTAKATDMIGPFCPGSTSSTADEGGVWLDGSSLSDADGNFFLDLPNRYGQIYPPADNWIFYDEAGNISVTDTLEGCQAAARPDVDPAYQSHCVECSLDDLEAEALTLTFLIPVAPVPADATGQLTGTAGISLNGFQIAAQAPVEDILSNFTIAAFDDCGGHVNPNDGYHYHAATGAEGCNSGGTEADGHAALLGYAMDGYGIYGSLADGDAEAGTLDQCNGVEDASRGYHYHAASPESNQHIGCFYGKTVSSGDDRPPRPNE